MLRPSRCGPVLVAIAVTAALFPGSAHAETPLGPNGTLSDGLGDVTDLDGAALAEARADIVSASAAYSRQAITFTLRVAQPTNPVLNPSWADGASSVTWVLDVTGDGEPDHLAILTGDSLALVGGVTDMDDPPEVLCPASAAFTADKTYTLSFDPACVGTPDSFSWGAVVSYDTNPLDGAAPVAVDIAPNGDSLAGPVVGPDGSGYWMVSASGDVYGFGAARHHGDQASPAVDIEPAPSMDGYWLLDDRGRVFAKGDAVHHGDATLAPGERAVSLSTTPSGAGYRIFTDRGRVVTFGDATFQGDMSGKALNGPVLDSVATPSGQGYWMVATDGGIFAFGDARFAGSMGGRPLNRPVMSMAPDPDGSGYWLVASDGGIFAFDAPFYGSMGGTPLNQSVSGMVEGDHGYLMVAEDGGIFAFGDVAFHGSMGSNPPARPIVAVALKRAA